MTRPALKQRNNIIKDPETLGQTLYVTLIIVVFPNSD